MKKTLVAIAALAASVGAMAQSSITLFGTLDPSIQNQKVTYNNGTAVKQNTIANSRRGTSQISFRGVEDLGSGLSALFMYEGDFEAGSQANATTPAATAAGNSTAPGNPNGNGIGAGGGEVYGALAGGFGSIKLGSPNTPTLTAQASRQPIGTKLGSGFGGVLGTPHVRENKSFLYETPNLGGFTAGLGYTFGVNGDAATGVPIVAVKPKTDIGLRYANGPINVGLALYGQTKDAANNGNKLLTAYGQYDLGVANLYLGLHNETKTASNVDSKSSGVNFGVKAPVGGGVTLLGNFGKLNDKSVANLDKTIFALGGEYALSKRSNLYTRFVKESNKNTVAATAVTGVQSMFLGLQHNF